MPATPGKRILRQGRSPRPDGGCVRRPRPVRRPRRNPAPGESAKPAGLFPTLTIDQARALALADAGVAESEADLSREALAEDNGIWVYEFRFRAGQTQYEYKLNANTGEIRAKVRESVLSPSASPTEPVMPSIPAGSAPPVETAPQVSAAPGPDQSAAPAATQPPASQPPATTPAPSQSAMYIGMDRAKAIALEHAGLAAAQVRFTQLQTDWEDGRMVYEVEFRQGRTEYEYEIDASTGRILDWDRDED